MIIFTVLLATLSVIQSLPLVVNTLGRRSSKKDDAESKAHCPNGYVVTYCEVKSGGVQTKSDGAYVDPRNGRFCVAVNGHRGSGAIARAACSVQKRVVNYCDSKFAKVQKFLNLHSRGAAPRVDCPRNYEQILCNARSPWTPLLTNKGVSAKGIIGNDRSCAVSKCTSRNWCEVTAVCRLKASCQAMIIVGHPSSRKDDARSKASCPSGYVVSYCEVKTGGVHTRSDGAYVDPSSGGFCVAVNGYRGSGVVARAFCSRNEQVRNRCKGKDRLPKFINLHSRGTAPRVSCPSNYEQILCNARSPWSGLLTNKGVSTKGIIPNDRSCAVSRCSTRNWCEVTAVCRLMKKCQA